MSNTYTNQILDRFVRTIEILKNKQSLLNVALSYALDYILDKIRNGTAYVIYDLKQVYYDTDVPPIEAFDYLICPRCNSIL